MSVGELLSVADVKVVTVYVDVNVSPEDYPRNFNDLYVGDPEKMPDGIKLLNVEAFFSVQCDWLSICVSLYVCMED